jgi:hypothetical protein
MNPTPLEKRPQMLQQAILVSHDNAAEIAATIASNPVQDIFDELDKYDNTTQLVLVREAFSRGFLIGHIVTKSMFWANATTVTGTINDETFTEVVQF